MFLDRDLVCFCSVISIKFIHFLASLLLNMFNCCFINFDTLFCVFLNDLLSLCQDLFSVNLQILTKLIVFFLKIFINNLEECSDSFQNEIQVPD